MAGEEMKKVPLVVIKRLPRYYRYLTEIMESGAKRVSSGELSEKMNCTASQIRQDLNCFGGFGQQGYGYNVEQLHATIEEILGLNRKHKVVIVGAGNLGSAILNYAGFERRGFSFIGIFDNSPKIVGTQINGHTVLPVDDLRAFCEENKPDIGVLAIPKTSAPQVAEILAQTGIKGIWNFSHMDLRTTRDIPIENVHLSDSLMTLSYKIHQGAN